MSNESVNPMKSQQHEPLTKEQIDARAREFIQELKKYREDWEAILMRVTNFPEQRIAEIVQELTNIALDRSDGILSWERITEIIKERGLSQPTKDPLPIFFHEDPAYWVAPYLVPSRISDCLTVLAMIRLESKIAGALNAGQVEPGYGSRYDWGTVGATQ